MLPPVRMTVADWIIFGVAAVMVLVSVAVILAAAADFVQKRRK